MFLTFITFLPIFGAFFLAFFPKENEGAIKQTALAVAAADFLLSLFSAINISTPFSTSLSTSSFKSFTRKTSSAIPSPLANRDS